MNTEILQKNLLAFSKRFPSLCEALLTVPYDGTPPVGVELISAKNKELSASFQNSFLHSTYNPTAEAQKLSQNQEVLKADSLVFLGVGLGYGAIECAKNNKSKTIIIIEPNPLFILLSFSILDWTEVIEHPSLVFLLEAPQQTVIAILERYGLKECFFIAQKAIMQHDNDYFTNIQTLVERNKDKQSINMKTLEKFSKLWLSNMSKNFSSIESLGGIEKFKNLAHFPACVLAAGPSLDEVLPYLEEIKKRCIIICVDTALRACLRVGVEPHIIILIDPQYWNARHITDLKSPSSILITESAAYPSVFRFHCKEIILCESLFPLGKYIENFSSPKGKLAAGGSVATSAWDFARFIGCTTIFMAGLDLAYPNKKTHVRGSTFEEKNHCEANKLAQTETALAKVLYNEHTEKSLDYEGHDIISDARMKLYAWWFESKCAQYTANKTYSLSKKSLAIPGIQSIDIEKVLLQANKETEIEIFCNTKRHTNITSHEIIISSLRHDFNQLQAIVKKGLETCTAKQTNEYECSSILSQLDSIDKAISQSSAKNIVSLVFPSPEKLEEIVNNELPYAPKAMPEGTFIENAQYAIAKASVLYTLIKKSIDIHIYYLEKNL